MSVVGRLVAGVAVAGIAIFGGVTAAGDDTTRDDGGEITEAGGLGVFAMQDGDCFMVPSDEVVTSVEAMPCADPHDAQKFATIQVPYVGDYDEMAVLESTWKTCAESFEAFVGVPYAESALYLSAFTPTEDGWAQSDREAACLIVSETGPVAFDARNSQK